MLHAMHERFQHACRLFGAANAEDPNSITSDGVTQPKELFLAQCLTEAVLQLDPAASEPLRLASRCQHIRRWEIPRSTQPMNRAGYLKWREELKKFHAETSGGILRQAGYPEEAITRVQELNLKKNLRTDPDCQTLEDALCLVFLRHQFDELIAGTGHEKMIKIVQKTWAKMSEKGQAAALRLDYSPQAQHILTEALA